MAAVLGRILQQADAEDSAKEPSRKLQGRFLTKCLGLSSGFNFQNMNMHIHAQIIFDKLMT